MYTDQSVAASTELKTALNLSSPSKNTGSKSVAIIGGGVTGLSAAYYALRGSSQTQVTLYEAASHWGGVLQTHRQDGFLIERSADSFLVSDELPDMRQLTEDLGLAERLIEPNQDHRRALIVRDGRLLPVPAGFQLLAATRLGPLMSSVALPFPARVRAACERFVSPRRDYVDESVTSFVTRRIGKTAFEYLAQPLVAGIYSADPDLLSAKAAIRTYVELERRYGSVTKGLAATNATRDAASGARYGKFRSFPSGMQTLVSALVGSLDGLGAQMKLDCGVSAVERTAHDWRVRTDAGTESYDRLVLAGSASSTASLMAGVDATLSLALSEIAYTTVAVVSLAVSKSSLNRPLDAFGVVVPRRERRSLIAASFSSVKFPGRAPDDQELVRVFIGGALQPELGRLPRNELSQLAADELTRLLNLSRPPRILDVATWSDASPQYNLGHLDRLSVIKDRVQQLPNLQIAGSGYEGVGLPQCVRAAKQAVEVLR